MPPAPDILPAAPPARLRRLVRGIRTEASTPGRDAVAVGVGLFLGCTPFYGFHLLLCVAAGTLLRLNRLKVYVAANISNPVMAPFLLFTELQTGALVRRGELHRLTLEAVRGTEPWRYGADLLVGCVVVGAVLGLTGAAVTWALTRGGDDPLFSELTRRASDRFIEASVTAWEFARGKLRGDPIYRAVLFDEGLPAAGTLVDVGCGTGLTLALLDEAAQAWREGRWPSGVAPPPRFDCLIGIELRPHAARVARRALGASATILTADARAAMPEACDVVLFFDVLQMMPSADQERLLSMVRDRLSAAGVVVVREADAAAGWRFRAVRAGNRAKALAFGHWRQAFHFRRADQWTATFERLGFTVQRRDMGEGTPFANVLFHLTVAPGPASTCRP